MFVKDLGSARVVETISKSCADGPLLMCWKSAAARSAAGC
jgi:hypothetical protein